MKLVHGEGESFIAGNGLQLSGPRGRGLALAAAAARRAAPALRQPARSVARTCSWSLMVWAIREINVCCFSRDMAMSYPCARVRV
jgi:hypothetical protein